MWGKKNNKSEIMVIGYCKRSFGQTSSCASVAQKSAAPSYDSVCVAHCYSRIRAVLSLGYVPVMRRLIDLTGVRK